LRKTSCRIDGREVASSESCRYNCSSVNLNDIDGQTGVGKIRGASRGGVSVFIIGRAGVDVANADDGFFCG